VYGLTLFAELGLLPALAVMAAVTIVYGSMRALAQDDLKKRLAYSTVSQVSYIALGAALLSPIATAGAIVHMVNQGIMKITLFFCAGLFAEELKLSKVSQLAGVGKRMPVTSAAFTIAALGMIGLPPLAGFISKWALGLGALDAGQPWVIAVLLTSTVLNAAYFLPIIATIWTSPTPVTDSATTDAFPAPVRRSGWEAPASLLLPAVATAVLVIGFGVTAGWDYSPWLLAQIVGEGAWP
jgi:multicomponent Na+:H+ antiporter subunit D